MADSKKNRDLIFFEPNRDNNEIPNTEDLSIFVELKSFQKGRSVLIDSEGVINENSLETPIGFIDGTKVGGGRRTLTTNYTEIGTRFTNEDINSGSNDLETLGIESIDITFDTAYTPLIKIKFIDIRGNAVLEQGQNSRYKMFFELPFPIFELTVKGFYGKPVTYCLHLTKWNASFNSSTGNFEIDTDFIGYTYALLTDCLLGYMRATVYTDIGSAKYLEFKNKYPNLMRIDEFLSYVGKIDNEFKKLKNTDENIKQINSLNKLSEDIGVLKEKLLFLKSAIINKNEKDELKNKITNLAILNKEVFNSDIESKIEKTKEILKTKAESINKNIAIDSLKINIDELIGIKRVKFEIELDDNEKTGAKLPSSLNGERKAKLQRIIDDKIGDKLGKYVLFDFKKCFSEIDRLRVEVKTNKKKKNDKLEKSIKQKVDTLKFKPTIRNIVNMLCIHSQIFLETIKEVSKNAENNEKRAKIIKELLSKKEKNKDKKIYPWPEYKKSEGDDGSVFESWMGSDIKNSEEYLQINEVMFVEELFTNLIKIGKKDEIRDLTGFGDTPDFFPVSPSEIKLEDNSLITKNPYYKAIIKDNLQGKSTTPQEAIRCLLFRTFTSLGVTNRLGGRNYIPLIGQLEAENLFNVINSEITNPIKKKAFINSIKEIASSSEGIPGAVNEITETWSKGGNIDGVTHPGDPESSNYGVFFTSEGTGVDTLYTYTYITGNTVTTTDGTRPISYIPISGGFNGKDFFTNDNKIKSIDELKELSNSLIFTSDYFGTSSSIKNDDGSLYFKILSDDNETPINGIPPIINSSSLQEYINKVDSETIIDEENLKGPTYSNDDLQTSKPKEIVSNDKLNRYNGIYKTLEINDIIYNTREDIGQKREKDSVIKAYFMSEKTDFGSLLGDGETNDEILLGLGVIGLGSNRKKFLPFNINKANEEKYKDKQKTAWVMPTTNMSIGHQRVQENPTRLGGRYLINDDSSKKLTKALIEQNNTDNIYVPFIEYRISINNDANRRGQYVDNFSLFGSLFYYSQKTNEAKAFLFLNSIPWSGILGEISDDGDVSLFDLLEDKDDDESFTIKGLYGNNGSLIKAPKLWCAFIGSLLYRYDTFKENDEDIINYKKSDGEPMFPTQVLSGTDKTYLPKHDEYLHYNGDDESESFFGIYLVMEETENEDNENYAKVDDVILNLPKQVREEFKRVFNNFVVNSFNDIQSEYELFKDVKDLEKKWTSLTKKIGIIENGEFKTTKKSELDGTTRGTDFDVSKFRFKGRSNNNSAVLEFVNDKRLKVSDIKDILGTTEKNSQGNEFGNVLDNYSNTSPISNNEFQYGISDEYNPLIGDFIKKQYYQFDLTLNNNDTNRDKLVSQFGNTYQIINSTPRIFRPKQEDYRISANKGSFEEVISNFFKRFLELTKDETNDDDDDRIQQRIFNNVDDDIIKLNIYRTLSSINDKWIGGNLIGGKCSDCIKTEKIVDTFRFMDSGFVDIGDDFLVNPLSIYSKMINNYNQSFFDLVNQLLLENNFNFIPLPNFIEFNTAEDMEKNIFTPYPYTPNTSSESTRPSFICTYVGQKSSQLNLGDNSEYEDDGIYLIKDGSSNKPAIGAETEVFKKKEGQKGYNIPYFLVSYGKNNQSFFKDIKLDQREFTETAESLEIIEDLSQNGDKNKVTYKGQNLFNTYQKRAYSAEVEMLGCATVQPMMYFQLDNIPMFRGAYLIFKTTHNITPHNMKTTFKGSRIKKVKTPLISSAQLFQNLIGSTSDVGEADRITDGDVESEGGSGSSDNGSKTSSTPQSADLSIFIDTPLNINIIPIDSSRGLTPILSENGKNKPIGLIKQPGNVEPYGIREVIEILQIIGKDFYDRYNRNIYYNDLSLRGGGDIADHHTHEVGLDIDFRPISKKPGATIINIAQDSKKFYDQKLTKKLVDKLVKARYFDSNGNETDQEAVNVIYFNDDALISEFDKVKKADGHYNHLHVNFNEPQRVIKDKAENNSGNPSENENSRPFLN